MIVFGFGTGRSGTVTLQRVLNSVPNMRFYHEGKKDFARPIKYVLKVYDGNKFNTYYDVLEIFYKNRTNKIIELRKKGFSFGEIDCLQYVLIPYLAKKYPNAKFIHLIRDGYNVTRSWSRRPTIYCKNVRTVRPIPFKNDPYYKIWKDMDRVQKLSWFWNHVVTLTEQLLKNHVKPHNRMLIKLEDFNHKKVLQMLEFCNLSKSYDHTKLRVHNSTAGSHWKNKKPFDWTNDNIRKFNLIAGETMRKYRYQLKG